MSEDTNPWSTGHAVEFMEELGALCRKYGVSLSACSCCEGVNVDTALGEERGPNVLTEVYADPESWDATVSEGGAYTTRERISSKPLNDMRAT